MRFLFLTLFLSINIFACENWMPESTIEFSMQNDGPTKDSVLDCYEKPQESCVCFDSGKGWNGVWSVAKVVSLGDESDGFKNKKVVNDEDKLAAFELAREDNARIVELARAKKREAKQAIKACNPSELEDASTIAGIKAALRKCWPHIIEAIKE